MGSLPDTMGMLLSSEEMMTTGLCGWTLTPRFPSTANMVPCRCRRREAYWYAYRRQGKRMLKKYTGRSADLSMAHLEAVAQALGTQTHPAHTVPARAQERSQRQKQRPLFVSQTGAREQASEFLNEHPWPPGGSLEQADALLLPKLRPPRLHSSLIPRERLLTRLDAGLEHQLTLLSAPAGFGKTTLVCAWMAARAASLPPVGWVALDAGDNDPLRFWRYLNAACQVFLNYGGNTRVHEASCQRVSKVAR
jgi:LuxR family maltose regulon positive regulatory protein